MLVLGTGVVTAVPLMLFAGAAQSVPFTLLGPLNLIVPVINVLLGWMVYDEPMPLDRLIGFGFVWIALVAVMWDRVSIARQGRRQRRRSRSRAERRGPIEHRELPSSACVARSSPAVDSLASTGRLLVAASIALAGCFTTSTDYQRDAEEFILGDEDLRRLDTRRSVGVHVGDLREPGSQNVGTTFLCTAMDDAGETGSSRSRSRSRTAPTTSTCPAARPTERCPPDQSSDLHRQTCHDVATTIKEII